MTLDTSDPKPVLTGRPHVPERDAERPGCDDRELRAQLAGHVGDVSEPLAEILDRVRELVSLRLDLAADGLGRAPVQASGCHWTSAPPRSAWLP